MAVVHKNFADYYNSLVSRVPTHHELLLRLCREETGERKAIEEQLSHALADLMHERGVMIAERKEIERNPTLKFEPSLTRLITLGMRQTNLELIRQRQQNPLVRQQPLIRAFPRAKYFTLLKEEEELRTWLSGVEHRLREKVEKECSHSWFLLVCLRQLVDHENEVRERIQQTEADQRVVIRRGVFRYAPPEFFRRQCVERTKGPVKEKTFEEEHLDSRAVVEAEELEEWKCMLRWLFDMYGVRLYSTSRCETAERYFIEEEEQKELWEKTLECTRESYGPYGKLTATIAWHGTSCTPLMRMLTCLPEKIREAAEAKAREANKYPPVHESSAESSRSVTPRQEVEEHEKLDEADIPKEAPTGSSPKKPASEDAGEQVAAEGVEDATEQSAEQAEDATEQPDEHEELDEADIPKEVSTGSSPKKPASEDAGEQVAAEGVEDATEQSAEQAEDATEQPDEHEELDEADIPKEVSTGSSPKKPASEDAGEQVAAEGVEDATEQPAEQAEDATEQPDEHEELDEADIPKEVSTGSSPKKPASEDAGEQVAAEGVEDATEQSAEQAEDATEQPDEHEELDEADIPKEVSTGSSPKKPASEDAGEQVAAEGVEDATEQPAEQAEDATEQPDEHEELDEADIPKEASTGSSPKKPASEDATEQPAEQAEDATEQPAEQAEDATEQPAEQAEDAGEQVAAEGVEDATEQSAEEVEDATEQPAEQAEDAVEQVAAEGVEDATEEPGEQAEDATEQSAEQAEDATEQPDEHEELDEADIPKEVSTGSSPKKPASEDAGEQVAAEGVEDATEQPAEEVAQETAAEQTDEHEELDEADIPKEASTGSSPKKPASEDATEQPAEEVAQETAAEQTDEHEELDEADIPKEASTGSSPKKPASEDATEQPAEEVAQETAAEQTDEHEELDEADIPKEASTGSSPKKPASEDATEQPAEEAEDATEQPTGEGDA